HPHAEDYARFRAVGERRRAPWPAWPAPLRDGVLREGDYEDAVMRYHLYVQWLADDQLQAVAPKARAGGPEISLELALGLNQASLIGEDLRTVPPEVGLAMARHNISRMYVMQYELQPQYQIALTPVYSDCIAVLNTHDMPPFAGWWQGLDVEDRFELGILNPA